MYITKTVRFECSIVSITTQSKPTSCFATPIWVTQYYFLLHYTLFDATYCRYNRNVDGEQYYTSLRKPSVEYDKIYIVCVHGNIGAGKSTYIAKQKDFVQLPEPIVEWGDKLDKYYKAVAKKPGTLSDADQNDIIAFEKLITEIRLKQYK